MMRRRRGPAPPDLDTVRAEAGESVESEAVVRERSGPGETGRGAAPRALRPGVAPRRRAPVRRGARRGRGA
jgi:hypothetical protein